MAKAKKSVKKYQSGGRIPSAMVDISRYPSLNTTKKDTAKRDTVKVTNKADTVQVNKNDIKPGNLSKSRMPVMKKSGGSKFPDLTGDGKVTQADILKGRGVFKKGGVNASMSDRMKNPKSASMMRYGGMKKAQMGDAGAQPERVIGTALNPSKSYVDKKEMEEKASVAKVQARQAGRNARAIERTDRTLQKQASKEANIKTRQENKTARQQSKDQKQVAIAKIIASKNKMDTKKKGGSVKHGKKK